MTSDWGPGSNWTTFEAWGGSNGITTAGMFVSERSEGVSGSNHASNDIDLTAAVQDWALGSVNYGVGLMFTSGDAADLSSSSDSVDYRPLLTVNYTVPEPATALLLCLGGSLVASRRRRK